MSYKINTPPAGYERYTEDLPDKTGKIPFEITFTKSGTTVASLESDAIVPVDGYITDYRITCQAAASVATATHLSIGYGGGSSDPDAFGAAAAIATLNEVGETADGSLATPNSACRGVPVGVYATNSSGAAAGTMTGTFTVTFWGHRLAKHNPIPS